MKNRILTIAFFLSSLLPVDAQTVQEWTQQKKTRLEYLVKQIAALRAYAGVAAKGYTIAREGLTAIQTIKQGDLKQHDGYVTSLKTVNPKVRSYWKVAAAIALQIRILAQAARQRKMVQGTKTFTEFEKNHNSSVFKSLLNGCERLMDELVSVTKDNMLQLKDDERLKRIDALYAAMQDRYTFLQHFCAEVNVLGSSQQQEQADVKSLRALYSVN